MRGRHLLDPRVPPLGHESLPRRRDGSVLDAEQITRGDGPPCGVGPRAGDGKPLVAPRTADELSVSQSMPSKYLEAILGELRRGGLLLSQRRPDGGYPYRERLRLRQAAPCRSGAVARFV